MAATVLDGRYQLIKKLGAGGFGQTYLARDIRRPGHPQCVVKQLRPASTDEEFIREARRLFNTEAEVLEKLGKHDQIPQLLAYFEEDNHFFLVQEFIDGTPLNQEWEEVVPIPEDTDTTQIQVDQPADLPLPPPPPKKAATKKIPKTISEREAIALLKDVLGILEFVHAEGVVHRDIKPDNLIRRRSDGRIVLIDFGAVKSLEGVQTQLVNPNGESRFTVSIGTPGYMASEQMAGRPNFTSDLYSLGMVIIRGLTGCEPTELPTDPDTGEVVWKDRAQVSNGLAMVLTRMTRYNHSQRYKSAREVLQGLAALCPEQELPPTDATRLSTTVAHPRRSTLQEPERTYVVSSSQSNAGASWLFGGLVAMLVIGLLSSLPLAVRRPISESAPTKDTPSDTASAPSPKPTAPLPKVTPDVGITVTNETINLAGTNSFVTNGLIPIRRGIDFNFKGAAGDQITVEVGDPSVVKMTIVNELNQPVAANAVNTSRFQGQLLGNGNYTIKVRPLKPENNTNYYLKFEILKAVIVPEPQPVTPDQQPIAPPDPSSP